MATLVAYSESPQSSSTVTLHGLLSCCESSVLTPLGAATAKGLRPGDAPENKRTTQGHGPLVVRLGLAGRLASEFRIKYLKTKNFRAPYLRFTSLSHKWLAHARCCPYDYCDNNYSFKTTLLMPVRLFLDLMHLMATRDEIIAEGYTCWFPHIPSQRGKNRKPHGLTYYELMLDNDHPGPMRVSEQVRDTLNCRAHGKMPKVASGLWGAYGHSRGGLLLSAQEDNENSERGSDNCDSAELRCVFPLCHGQQLRSLLSAVYYWLREDYKTKDLSVRCFVPSRVTLFPEPRSEDGYQYRDYTLMRHWPQMCQDELSRVAQWALEDEDAAITKKRQP